jgi:hypothetical protein
MSPIVAFVVLGPFAAAPPGTVYPAQFYDPYKTEVCLKPDGATFERPRGHGISGRCRGAATLISVDVCKRGERPAPNAPTRIGPARRPPRPERWTQRPIGAAAFA